MARPKKKGLDYFPVDVDIFEDEKIFDVQNDYGPLGEVIYIRLLCLVYRNGYYYKFESLDNLAAMIIRSVGNRWAKDKKTVKDVILYLAEINLFSSELMHRNVITSRSIQERYLLAVERRRSKIEEYSLLEKNDSQEALLSAPENQIAATQTQVNVTETPVNVSDNPTKKSKVNEIKLNERKEDRKAYIPDSRLSALYNLSREQYEKLVSMSSSSVIDRYIDKIIEWQDCSGKMCRNPFETITKWISEDNSVKKSEPPKDTGKDTSYDLDEFEKYAMTFNPNLKEQ